jgi:hypothetical protein
LAAQTHGPCELKTFFIRKTFKDITPVPNHKKLKKKILLGYLAQLSQSWSIKVITYANYLKNALLLLLIDCKHNKMLAGAVASMLTGLNNLADL